MKLNSVGRLPPEAQRDFIRSHVVAVGRGCRDFERRPHAEWKGVRGCERKVATRTRQPLTRQRVRAAALERLHRGDLDVLRGCAGHADEADVILAAVARQLAVRRHLDRRHRHVERERQFTVGRDHLRISTRHALDRDRAVGEVVIRFDEPVTPEGANDITCSSRDLGLVPPPHDSATTTDVRDS